MNSCIMVTSFMRPFSRQFKGCLLPVLLAACCLFSACATLEGGQETRLQTLEQEASELEARLVALESATDESEQELAQVRAELLVLRSSVQARDVASGNAAMDSPAMDSSAMDSSNTESVPQEETDAPPPTAPAEVETSPPPEPPAQASPPPVSPTGTAALRALYDRALALTRNGQTAQARPLFEQFLSGAPRHELAPNAYYWLGETFYHEHDYGQAILTFKEVPRLYPDHSKAPAAMLKIGFSYEKLGDVSNARFYLQTLVEEYPGSEPAQLAAAKLREL
ncbi:MAG: tol-pal system protein YbgF [Desulfovibrio sp.]|nr:MAG: tol-pal system protein YbgF [Desulfovibrio sp.]